MIRRMNPNQLMKILKPDGHITVTFTAHIHVSQRLNPALRITTIRTITNQSILRLIMYLQLLLPQHFNRLI